MARKIGLAGLGTNQAATTKRILAIFDRATPADIEAGAQWYGAASEIARDMSDASGYSFVRTLRVPRVRPGRYLRHARPLRLRVTGDVDHLRAPLRPEG